MYLQDRLKLGNTKRIMTDEGFLIVPARIGRTGIQEYFAAEMGLTDRDPKDVVRVFRPPEEVFKDESMQSFANKPVTNNHPPVLVNADNSRQFSVGMSGPDVTKDEAGEQEFLSAMLTIIDGDTIKEVESGKVELSNGYTADIDFAPGVTPGGEQFDAVQRNIKGNHIAIVTNGRAGPVCRVADSSPNNGEKVKMAKVTIDAVDYEVSEQAAQAVVKLQSKLSDAEEEMRKKDQEMKKKDQEMEEQKKKDKATSDGIQAKLDDALTKIPDAKQLNKLVNDRMALVQTIQSIAPDIKVGDKDSQTLMKEVVAAKFPNVQMDSVSTDYIQARFDIIMEDAKKNPGNQLDGAMGSMFQQKKTTDGDGKTVDNRPADVIAREKFVDSSRNAWKRPEKKQA